MLARRIVVILCLLSLLPTAVDPSCVGYFVYSNSGLAALLGDESSAETESVARCDRPVEGMAAARFTAPLVLEPLAVDGLWIEHAPMPAASAVAASPRRGPPPHLATHAHATHLRHCVFLI